MLLYIYRLCEYFNIVRASSIPEIIERFSRFFILFVLAEFHGVKLKQCYILIFSSFSFN